MEYKPKFSAGSIISRSDFDNWRGSIHKVLIEDVIIENKNKTFVYIIEKQRIPTRYIEKRYKLILSSLLSKL